MTFAVSPVANTDTFLKLLNTVNLLANIASNSALTVGANSAGDSGVTGSFYCTNLFATNGSILATNINGINIFATNVNVGANVFVGNSTSNVILTSSSIVFKNTNTSLSISTPNTSQISNGQFFLNANGSFTTVPSISYPLLNSSLSTSNSVSQIIDFWNYTTYNIANYNICVIDNVANNFYSSKISMMCGKGNASITEYAILTSNTSVGVFSVSTNSTSAILNFTPVSQSTTVKFFRELI